jgi:hypothetical protein
MDKKMSSIISKQIGNYTIHIIRDFEPVNPRNEYENFGTLIVFSNRYNLSDNDNYLNRQHLESYLHKNRCISLPIYLGCYQEPKLSLDGDERYLSGYIFVEKEKVLKEWKTKKIIPEIEKQVLDNMKAEIETFNHYIEGNCYGYVITEENEEYENEIDSCWGFYGEPETILQQVESILFQNGKLK